MWWETYPARIAIHRLVGVARCDLELMCGTQRLGSGVALSDGSGGRLRIEGECPCRDFLVDMLVESDQFLARNESMLTNPPGAVRSHIRMRAAGDWTRRRRTTMGAQARIDRIRNSARARRLGDDLARAIMEFLADEAGSLAPLEGDDALARRLAERVADEFGGTVAARLGDVRAALPLVEEVCRCGPTSDPGDGCQLTWWERYIEHPLGRRARRGDVELDRLPSWESEPAYAVPAYDAVVEPHDDQEAAVLVALLDPPSRHAAASVRAAVLDLADRGVLSAEIAAGFASDQHRVAIAVEMLIDLRRRPGGSRTVVPAQRGVGHSPRG